MVFLKIVIRVTVFACLPTEHQSGLALRLGFFSGSRFSASSLSFWFVWSSEIWLFYFQFPINNIHFVQIFNGPNWLDRCNRFRRTGTRNPNQKVFGIVCGGFHRRIHSQTPLCFRREWQYEKLGRALEIRSRTWLDLHTDWIFSDSRGPNRCSFHVTVIPP